MRIFVSYRREDAAGQAGRLHDALVARFGEDAVFHDVSAIRPGEDFKNALARAIADCDVMLVVVGPRWASVSGPEGQPRLLDLQDYVRQEVTTALGGGKRIIPVTVAGAHLPEAASLPEELRPLLTRQSVDLRDTNWRTDFEALVGSLRNEPRLGGLALRRSYVLAAVGGLAILAVLAAWQPWSALSGSNGDGSSGDLTPSCSPRLQSGDRWVPLDLVEDASGTADESLYRAVAAGYRNIEPDRWTLQVRMRKTNQSTSGDDQRHADYDYDGIAVDGLLYEVDCFTPLAGGDLFRPGLSNEALVGIETASEPRGQIEVAVKPTRIIVHAAGD
jgi:hypothetical protein